MKVRALMLGYFDHVRRREGDVFTIPDKPRRDKWTRESQEAFDVVSGKDGKVPQAFSTRWMELVHDSIPEKTSTAQEGVDKASADIKSGRQRDKAPTHVI